ncbi:ATP-binding protein [Thaumasiovibrio sp. DFM-14]|uniref:ATP-binding protein n=1 Tax=Thaumasiovibrio sp. DFM-14 TaxID=3384792 RepID=UPI0039A04979
MISFKHCFRLIVTFILLYQFSVLFLVDPEATALSAFFPAPAFIMALSYSHGLRIFPFVFIAAAFASLFDVPLWELTSFNWLHIARQTLVYVVAGGVLRQLSNASRLNLSEIRVVWTFLLVSLIATILSGISAALLLYGYGFVRIESLSSVVVSFLVGDLTGVLMFSPLAFTLENAMYGKSRPWWSSLHQKELRYDVIGVTSLMVVLSVGLFAAIVFQPALSHYHYLIILPVALISARNGVQVGVISAFVVNVLSASLYVLMQASLYSVTEIQMLFAMTALIALILGAYHDNQRSMHVRLRDSQALLSNLAQKSSLNELSSTIAHEVASPLQTALMNSQLSISLLRKGEQLNRGLLLELNQDVEFALDKAVQIHRRISKGVTQGQFIQVEPVSIERCVLDAQRLLQESIGKSMLDIKLNAPQQQIAIEADKLGMTQVFLNLFKNSIQAGASQVVIELIMGEKELTARVCDNGCGISPSQQSQIFQSLYSTKPDGIGLGLAVCRTIIEGIGGHIDIEPMQGRDSSAGCTFRIVLPMMEANS